MGDSPEMALRLDQEIEMKRASDILKNIHIKPDLVVEGPDQENNVREVVKVFENNNDDTMENLEEFKNKKDVDRRVKPEKKVTLIDDRDERSCHQVVRETKYHMGDTILTTKPFAFVINASHRLYI